MPTTPRSLVVRPGEGGTIRGPVGGPARLLVTASETAGRFTAIDNVIPPNQGPPLHRHRDEDECYWVLEGQVRFRLDERLAIAPTGSFVYIPRGTPHAFRNDGDVPSRLLVMFAPAGMERLFQGLAALPDGPVTPELYRSVAEAARMELLGPPLDPPSDGGEPG